MGIEHHANGRNDLQNAGRNFNQTQQPDYSAEKIHPGRAHTLDDADLIHHDSHMSPQRHRGIDYITEDSTTQDMTRVGNYKSAQKIRLGKKTSVEASPMGHGGMNTTIHSHLDAGHESLPNVRGASKSKRTVH